MSDQQKNTPVNNPNLLQITVPWPPSANRYWRNTPQGVRISENGRKYRQVVAVLAARHVKWGPRAALATSYSVKMEAYPPDRRKRDIDNLFKASLDAFTYSGVWADDSLVNSLAIVRREVDPVGDGYIFCQILAHVGD